MSKSAAVPGHVRRTDCTARQKRHPRVVHTYDETEQKQCERRENRPAAADVPLQRGNDGF